MAISKLAKAHHTEARSAVSGARKAVRENLTTRLTHWVNQDKRALELYRLALSLVEAEGRFVPVGMVTTKEYRVESLGITWLPSSGHLDVWHRHKVLTVNIHKGSARATYYIPGDWEEELEEAAKLRPRGGEGTSKI
jgi:hypothetical protein